MSLFNFKASTPVTMRSVNRHPSLKLVRKLLNSVYALLLEAGSGREKEENTSQIQEVGLGVSTSLRPWLHHDVTFAEQSDLVSLEGVSPGQWDRGVIRTHMDQELSSVHLVRITAFGLLVVDYFSVSQSPLLAERGKLECAEW